jgi:hypothetical protein
MAQIKLLRGQTALVDDEDLPKVSGYRWRLSGEGYVVASVGSRWQGTFQTLMLHRLVLGTPPGMESDHRDTTNRLDNRRSNLRIATKSQNQGNRRKTAGAHTSRFKGVYWYRRGGCWKASGPKQKPDGSIGQSHLGYFQREEDAARAYNQAALKHWGEFALINRVSPSTF